IGVSRVDKNKSIACRDQIGANRLEADVVDIVENLKRSPRIPSRVLPGAAPGRFLIPVGAPAALYSRDGEGTQKAQKENTKSTKNLCLLCSPFVPFVARSPHCFGLA